MTLSRVARSPFVALLGFLVSSSLLQVSNKVLLSHYKFESSTLLALAQLVFTVGCSLALHAVGFSSALGTVSFAGGLRRVMPIPIYFALSIVLGTMPLRHRTALTLAGLAASGRLSLPMFAVLRRTQLLLALVIDIAVARGLLAKEKRRGPPLSGFMRFTVVMMVVGGIVAAYDDLAFDAAGYCLIMADNLVQTLQGLSLLRHLDKSNSMALGELGVMFFRSVAAIPVVVAVIFIVPGEFGRAVAAVDSLVAADATAGFYLCFASSVALGMIMWLFIIWSLKVAQAISLGVVQVFRTNAITLGSMYHRHHLQSTINSFGIVLSVLGNVLYAAVENQWAAQLGWVDASLVPVVDSSDAESREDEASDKRLQ